MIEHILLPGIPLKKGLIHPAYEQYLKEWREDVIQKADVGDVAASICHQATLIDLVMEGKLRHDWLGIMDAFLLQNDMPLAYSEVFSKRLHKFGGQYHQSTIHAIYTRWWIECIAGVKPAKHESSAKLILQKKQTDGLIYDRDVSETILRHRMKTELTMSAAMAVEILNSAHMLSAAKSL